jgi:hypothetical protein
MRHARGAVKDSVRGLGRWMVRALIALTATSSLPSIAEAQRVIELEYTPTRRAQIAVWVAREDGSYLATLSLTQSVSLYGIGNRPGALQMNSGYRWPYGRREGVLPVWAHARASEPGALLFPRVIFQDRVSEGWASRSATFDFSRDDHFCLAFRGDSSRDGLDAVSCPSIFNSDKGRYLTSDDVARGYLEPMETVPGVSATFALDPFSLYPPRRDVRRCTNAGCYDHPDVDRFQDDARAVMPELDAITIATPPGEMPQRLVFDVPEAWEDGPHHVFVEVNTEGDYAPDWGPSQFPTPRTDRTRPVHEQWDGYAEDTGYPYRGQPSVVYRLTVDIGSTTTVEAAQPIGYGSVDGRGSDGGAITSMDGSIMDDASGAPGSGVDRLHALDPSGARVRLRSEGPEACMENVRPGPIEGLASVFRGAGAARWGRCPQTPYDSSRARNDCFSLSHRVHAHTSRPDRRVARARGRHLPPHALADAGGVALRHRQPTGRDADEQRLPLALRTTRGRAPGVGARARRRGR